VGVSRYNHQKFPPSPREERTGGEISATKWEEGVVDYFRGKTWRGNRAQDLRHHVAALSFFTDKAFRYWLPAFMLAELENPDEPDIIAEHIAFELAAHSGARLQKFAQDELEAIVSFLSECAGRYRDETRYRDAERTVRARLQKA